MTARYTEIKPELNGHEAEDLRPRRFTATKPDLSKVVPFEWAWEARVLLGYLNLLVGDEGVGKGTILAYLAARWTRGDLPGDLKGKPTNVLIVGDEDGFNGVWVPRLEAAGADLERIRDLPADEDGEGLTLPRDLSELKRDITEEEIKIVIFDQFLDNLDADVDDWRTREVRRAVAPVRRWARGQSVALLAALHTNKSRTRNFREKTQSSQAFNALSRSSLFLAEHPEDSERRVLARPKGNYAKRPEAKSFKVEGVVLEINGRRHEVGKVADLKDEDFSPEDLLGGQKSDQSSKAATARKIISMALADGQEHEARPIITACTNVAISKTAVFEAAKELGVEKRKTEGVRPRAMWKLPTRAHAQRKQISRKSGKSGRSAVETSQTSETSLSSATRTSRSRRPHNPAMNHKENNA